MGELLIGLHTYGTVQRRGDANKVTIGKYCSLASNIVIDSGFNHNAKFVSTFPFQTRLGYNVESNVICKGDVTIGNDVWICENVLIMSGVTIGDGAVIGANSIVTKDVRCYDIVAGSPAKLIKQRFDSEQIKYLMHIKWWDWSEEKIKENASLLNGSNISDFINKHI